MYFWNTKSHNTKWGLQGDVQYRNWNLIGDLEQLLLRGGVTYTPANVGAKFTFGYANIQTGKYGQSKSRTGENRIYQEALIPNFISKRIQITHRFRFEQRFVENQDFRTRYRYNLFLNIPINKPTIERKTFYLALYNELFINGERNIGNGRRVELFDRNRSYAALGYVLFDQMRMQLGYMRQLTDNIGKNQIQLSVHHQF